MRPRRNSIVLALAALAAGGLLPLSLAPFDWWPVGIVSVAAWFWLLTRFPQRALVLGYAYGLGKFGVGASWIYVSIHLYGNAAPWLAAGLVLIFVGGLSLFTLLQALAYAKLQWKAAQCPGGCWLSNAVLFCAVWVLFEWLLTWFLTGFPWLYPGYGHLDTWLASLLPLGGVTLASLGAAASACFLAAAMAARGGWMVRAGALGLAGVPWLLGLALFEAEWVTPTAQRSAALVQGNVDQEMKWRRENRAPIVALHERLTAPHWGRDLIVWPEAAITLHQHQAAELLNAWSQRGAASGSALVLGIPWLEPGGDGAYSLRNAALAVGDNQSPYFKRRLVPFGDYLPFAGLLRGLIDFFDLPMSNAEPGPWRQPPLQVGADRAALAICYEIAYADLTRSTASAADLLVNVTNDTWFGRSIGPPQHFQIARARALENGRWLLRAASNGITAIVDHKGKVQAQLPQFQPGVLTGTYQIMTGRTPYSRFGDRWLIALCAATLLFFLIRPHLPPLRRGPLATLRTHSYGAKMSSDALSANPP